MENFLSICLLHRWFNVSEVKDYCEDLMIIMYTIPGGKKHISTYMQKVYALSEGAQSVPHSPADKALGESGVPLRISVLLLGIESKLVVTKRERTGEG